MIKRIELLWSWVVVLFIIKKATLEDQLHPMNFQKMIYKYSALVTIFKKDDLLNPLST